ncbi:MAG: hypothetical protein V4813_01435 [Gemmatimonadota bacterium]
MPLTVRNVLWWVLPTCLSMLAAARPLPGQVSSAAAAVQRHGAQFDAAELAAVERGDVALRVLPTTDQRDVAVLGIVRLPAARHEYLRRVQDFRTWLRSPTRVALGVFSEPAVVADVAAMHVSRQDANDLRKCRAGDCTTKLPAAEIDRVRAEVDWRADDRVAQVSVLARRRLVQLVEEYRARGNAALPIYDDRPAVRADEAFAAVLAQSGYLRQVAPSLAQYLQSFPRERPAGVADVIFWSEEAVPRLRPILSLTHAVVYTPPELGGTTIVLSKQLYANHYFEAALESRTVIDRDVAGDTPSVYLVVERRFRFDNLPRGGILNIRGRAVSGLRDQLLAELRRERAMHAPETR